MAAQQRKINKLSAPCGRGLATTTGVHLAPGDAERPTAMVAGTVGDVDYEALGTGADELQPGNNEKRCGESAGATELETCGPRGETTHGAEERQPDGALQPGSWKLGGGKPRCYKGLLQQAAGAYPI